MEPEKEFLSTGTLHLNRIGLWSEKQIKNKFHGPESSLFEAVSPVFYIIRVLGLAPYRFSKKRLVSSNAQLFFCFVAFFTNTYVVFNYVTIITDLITTIWSRNQFIIIWNIIQDFDHETDLLGFPQIDKKTKFWGWVIIINSIFIWLWINQTGMYAFLESAFQNVSYMFVYIGTSCSIIKFSGMTAIIGQRFKHLNKIAWKCSPNTWISSSKIDQKVVEKLRGVLMEASEKLNSLYYWSLLLWLFNLSFHAVSGMYFFIQWLLKDIDNVDFPIYCCLGGWIVAHILQLAVLCCSCQFASTEANRIDYILLNWQRWQTYHNKKRDFESTIHLMNYKLNFSAGGCCYVNLPLLRSIAGLLTTYLIILLQLPN